MKHMIRSPWRLAKRIVRRSVRPGVMFVVVVVAAAGVGTYFGVRHRISMMSHLAWEFSRPTPREAVELPGVDLERALEGLIEVRPFLQRTAEELRQLPRRPISDSTAPEQVW